VSDSPIGAEAAPACFPGTEEIRMVRSIALLAFVEAMRQGRWGASFHGFRVQAQRLGPARGLADFTEVSLSVSLGQAVVARCRVIANHASAMEPNARTMVI
jgi:hypothetical protein